MNVKNTKIRTPTPEISELVQKKLFELGCEWINGSKFINCAKEPFLFIDEDYKITYSNSKDTFNSHKCNELTPSHLGIDSEEKPITQKKNALIEEATEKYKIGDKFKDLVHNIEFEVKDQYFTYYEKIDTLYVQIKENKKYSNKTARIYNEGKWAEVTSISESKFEVGKWYVNPGWLPNSIMKFSKKKDENKLYFSESFENRKDLTYTKYWIDYDKKTRLATKEEIQEYLPDGHPDKIKTKEKKSKPLIDELKEDYPLVYEAVLKNNKKEVDVHTKSLSSLFVWDNSPEGSAFWVSIADRNFKKAKELCPHLFVDDTKLSTDEDLLKEARKRYPIGTKAICVLTKEVEEIKSDLEWQDTEIIQKDRPYTRVYWKTTNKWAEIVETDKKTKNTYQVDEKFQEAWIKDCSRIPQPPVNYNDSFINLKNKDNEKNLNNFPKASIADFTIKKKSKRKISLI